MEKIVIHKGEVQPIPCTNCNGIHGYILQDTYRMRFTAEFDGKGRYIGGDFSDEKITNKGVKVKCANCGAPLKFRLNRD